jgi:hypothetical protein
MAHFLLVPLWSTVTHKMASIQTDDLLFVPPSRHLFDSGDGRQMVMIIIDIIFHKLSANIIYLKMNYLPKHLPSPDISIVLKIIKSPQL